MVEHVSDFQGPQLGSAMSEYLVHMGASHSGAFLKPARALAENIAVHPSMFNLQLFVHCEALYTASMEQMSSCCEGSFTGRPPCPGG